MFTVQIHCARLPKDMYSYDNFLIELKLHDRSFRCKDTMVKGSSPHTLHDRILRLVTLVETVTRIRIIVGPTAP